MPLVGFCAAPLAKATSFCYDEILTKSENGCTNQKTDALSSQRMMSPPLHRIDYNAQPRGLFAAGVTRPLDDNTLSCPRRCPGFGELSVPIQVGLPIQALAMESARSLAASWLGRCGASRLHRCYGAANNAWSRLKRASQVATKNHASSRKTRQSDAAAMDHATSFMPFRPLRSALCTDGVVQRGGR
uniref:Uncharacterized protein n=1 Tax=Arundo donax TaxID=35708 RepID=A0A0A9ADW8_ARUDO